MSKERRTCVCVCIKEKQIQVVYKNEKMLNMMKIKTALTYHFPPIREAKSSPLIPRKNRNSLALLEGVHGQSSGLETTKLIQVF